MMTTLARSPFNKYKVSCHIPSSNQTWQVEIGTSPTNSLLSSEPCWLTPEGMSHPLACFSLIILPEAWQLGSQGSTITWWGVSSCTSDMQVLGLGSRRFRWSVNGGSDFNGVIELWMCLGGWGIHLPETYSHNFPYVYIYIYIYIHIYSPFNGEPAVWSYIW